MTRSHDKVKDINNVSQTDINKTSINSSFCVDIASKKLWRSPGRARSFAGDGERVVLRGDDNCLSGDCSIYSQNTSTLKWLSCCLEPRSGSQFNVFYLFFSNEGLCFWSGGKSTDMSISPSSRLGCVVHSHSQGTMWQRRRRRVRHSVADNVALSTSTQPSPPKKKIR